MTTWRQLAKQLFPERCHGYWGFHRSHMSLYRIFFELADDIDELIQANNDEEIGRIFQLVNWCFEQRNKNKDTWNAAATAFLEHLADTDERAKIIPRWVKPPLFDDMREEFQKRRERNGEGKFAVLIADYNRENSTNYTLN